MKSEKKKLKEETEEKVKVVTPGIGFYPVWTA